MKKVFISFIILILLSGCGDKKIDSSSDERLKKSMDAVKTSLDEEKKKEFEEAIQAIAFSETGDTFEVASKQDAALRKIKDKLNGKTAAEIIAEGEKLIIERKKKEHEEVINEINEVKIKISELDQKQAKAEQDKESLKQFKVLRSLFYWSKSVYVESPVIELTVRNDTKYPVSRAYFHGVLSTPGRSVPWIQDSFDHTISGGLEPGEEATWKLEPDMLSEWGNAPRDRNDMVLTVSVTRIDGLDEKAIFDCEFSEQEQKTLKELLERLEELQKKLSKLERELM